MRIRKTTGHIVYKPLSYSFTVVELGGSNVQKYDTMSDSYVPNRMLTPYMLQPHLVISSTDNTMVTGDYTSQLNVTWNLTLVNLITGQETILLGSTAGETYTVNAETKALTLSMNVPPSSVLKISLDATYVDRRRHEVQRFAWSTEVITERQSDWNITLDTGRWKSKIRLSPFKHWGQFAIPVQLKHGDNAVDDADAVYQWQWWDTTNRIWSEDFSEQPWLVSGEQTKQLTVDQDFIQNILLRVKAYHVDAPSVVKYFSTRLKRWYGQYDYDVEFLTGKYIFRDTDMVVLNAWVANRRGNISSVTKYFDVELFFATGDEDLRHVAYGEEAIVKDSRLSEGSPSAGILCRELSAMRALALDDEKVLCLDDGTPLFAQFPVKTREV